MQIENQRCVVASIAEVVRQGWGRSPQAAIILGSGLGDLARSIHAEAEFAYDEIPGFPQSTALGHAGKLICGELEGVPLLAFRGRFHLYEGYTAEQAALPVRLAKKLGAELLIVSNAAGAVNPTYRTGDLMVIEDQINFMFANPLIGENDEMLGPRFPDMSAPYDSELIDLAGTVARRECFRLHQGVYLALLGPTYETRAEYRMARILGADVVGMSTIPETLAAVHAGMRVLGISTVTNLASPDSPSSTCGHEVISVASGVSLHLEQIVRSAVNSLLPAEALTR